MSWISTFSLHFGCTDCYKLQDAPQTEVISTWSFWQEAFEIISEAKVEVFESGVCIPILDLVCFICLFLIFKRKITEPLYSCV